MIGSTTFCFILYSTGLTRRVGRITNNLVSLFTILPKYHEFMDIFSKTKAETLASHHLYDLQIKLENKKKPLIKTIYSLSTVEQEVFKKFI